MFRFKFFLVILLLLPLSLFVESDLKAADYKNPLGQPLSYDALVRCYGNRGVQYLEGEDAVNFFQVELSACPDEGELILL